MRHGLTRRGQKNLRGIRAKCAELGIGYQGLHSRPGDIERLAPFLLKLDPRVRDEVRRVSRLTGRPELHLAAVTLLVLLERELETC